MTLAMARPHRRASGTFYVRKVIPTHLRPFLGGRWELREDLPTTNGDEAKRLAGAAIARLETVVASARAQADGQTQHLSLRDIEAIVAADYAAELASYDDDPGQPEHWEDVQSHYAAMWAADETDPQQDRRFRPDRETRERAEALLRSHGIAPDRETIHRTAERWAEARIRLAERMQRRLAGDWSPDPYVSAAPTPRRADRGVLTAAVPFADLVAAWALENNRSGKALYDRKSTVQAFARFLGHDDAAKVTPEDVVRWKEARLAQGRSPKTVANDMNKLSPIWRWARANRKLPPGDNPFAGLAPRQRQDGRRARRPYSDAEARGVLEAARKETGYLRWLPWLLAFVPARIAEACQSVKEDVAQVGTGGPWCLRLHMDGETRRLKNPQSERIVPLHPALIDEGFLDYVAALTMGSPLFPDIRPDKFGARGGTATKKYGRWVRRVAKVTDARVDPAHGWRHLFEDRGRAANVPQTVIDALMGHKNAANESEGYGRGYRFMPSTTAEWVARMANPMDT